MKLEKFYLLGKDFINDFNEDYEDFVDNMQNEDYAKEFKSNLPLDGSVVFGSKKAPKTIDYGQVFGITDEPRRLENGVYIPSMNDYGIVMKNNSIDRLKRKPEVTLWDQIGQGFKRLGHDTAAQGQNVFNSFDYYGNLGGDNLDIKEKSTKIELMKQKYKDLLNTILSENREFDPKLVYELPQLKTIREAIKFLEDDLQYTIKSYTKDAVKKRDEFALREKGLSRMFDLNPDADTWFSDVMGGVGSSIGLMAMSAPFGPASGLAMAGLGGLAEGQALAQEVWNLTEGMEENERLSKANAAFMIGNPIGWSEMVPLQRGIDRIFKEELKKGWKDFAKKIAAESLEEGLQEGVQTAAEEITKAGLVDKYKIQWDQIPYAAAIGAMSGGVTSGGMYATNVATQDYFGLNEYIKQQKNLVDQLYKNQAIDENSYKIIKENQQKKTRKDWKQDYLGYQSNLEALGKTEKTINKIKAGEDLSVEEETALKQTNSYKQALAQLKDSTAAYEQVLGNIKALEVSLDNNEITELQKELANLELKKQEIKFEGRKALNENIYQDTKVFDSTLASIVEKPSDWFLSQETENETRFVGVNNDLIVSKDKSAKVVDKQNNVVREIVQSDFTSTLEAVKDVFEPVMTNPVTFHLEEDVSWLPTENKVMEENIAKAQEQYVQKIKADIKTKLKQFEETQVKDTLSKFNKKIAYKATVTAKIDNVLKAKSVFEINPTEENLSKFAKALSDFGIDPNTYIDPENPIESTLQKIKNDEISVSENWVPVKIETPEKVINTYFEVKASLLESNKSKYSVTEEVYEDAMQISAEVEQALRSMPNGNQNIEAELDFYLEGNFNDDGLKARTIINYFSELMIESFEQNGNPDKLKNAITKMTPVINSTIDRVWTMYQQAKSSTLKVKSGNFIISSVPQAIILKKVFGASVHTEETNLNFSEGGSLVLITQLQYDFIMNSDIEEAKQSLREANLQRLPNNAFNFLLETPNVTSVPKPKAKGINISSYEGGLGGKLTNFAPIPIEYNGKTYKSVEDAYQTNKPNPPTDEAVYSLMVELITLKLQQHPDLVKEINDNGGMEFLNNSTHNLINKSGVELRKGDRWVSTGKNLFMKALRAAYQNASKTSIEAQGDTNSDQSTESMAKEKEAVVRKLTEFLEKYGFEVKDSDDLLINLALKSISLDKSDLTQVAKALSEPLSEMLSYSDYFFEIQEAIKKTEYFKKVFESLQEEFKGSTKKNFNRLTTKKIFKELLEKGFNEEFAKQLNINKTLLQKIKDFITEIIAKLKDANWAIVDKNIQKIVENTFKGEEFIRLTPKKGYKQVDFQEAFDTNPLAREIMVKIGTNPNIVLTGSIAYATQGTVYRNINTIVHDLDLVNTGLTAEEINELVLSNYPEAVKAYEFAESRYKVDTFLIPPAGHSITDMVRRETGKITSYNVRNQDGEIVGKFKLDFEISSTGGTINETENKEGVQALYVDFFSGDTKYRDIFEHPLKDGNQTYTVKLSGYEGPFEAKLAFSRFKDIWDYNRFIPNRNNASKTNTERQGDLNAEETTKSTSEGKKVSTGKFLPSEQANRLKRVVDDAKNWFNGWFVFDTVAYFGQIGFGSKGVPAANAQKFNKETVNVKELRYAGAILVDTLDDITQGIISYAQNNQIAIVTREQLQRLKEGVHTLFKRTRIYASSGKGYYDNTAVNAHMADLTVSLYQNNLVAEEIKKEEMAIEQGSFVINEYGKSEWVKKGSYSQRYFGMNLQVGMQENWQIHATALADQIIRGIEAKKKMGENIISIYLTGNELQYLNLTQEEVDKLLPKFLDEVFQQVQDKIQRDGSNTKVVFRSGLASGMEEAMFKWAMNQKILTDFSMDIAIPSNYRLIKSDGTVVYDMEEFFGRFAPKQEVKTENPKLTVLNKDIFQAIFSNKEDIKSSYGKDPLISDWTDFVLENLDQDVAIRIVKSDFIIPNTQVNLVNKRAAYHRGVVYINEDIITTPLEFYREVSHELTHQFLNNLLDTNASFYNEILVIARDTFKFLRAHPEYVKNQTDYDRILRYEATEQHKFVKEFVAYAMSNTSNLNEFMRLTEYKDGQRFWARFVNKIKNFIKNFYGEQGKYPTLMDALENVLERRVGYKKNIQTMMIEPVLKENDSTILSLTNTLIETDSFVSAASVRSLGYEIAKANNIDPNNIPNDDHIAYLQTLSIKELQRQLYAISGYRESLELIYQKSKKKDEEFEDFEKATITHIFNTINNLRRYNVIRPVGQAYKTPTGGVDYNYTIEELPLNYKDHEGTSKSSYFNDIRLNNTLAKLSNALGTPMKIAFVEQVEKISLTGKTTYEKIVRPGMSNANNVSIVSGKYLWVGNFGALNSAIAIEFQSEEEKLKVLDLLAQINEEKFGLDITESETRLERLAIVFRLMIEDIRIGAKVGESFNPETFVNDYQNVIKKDTNMIKVLKRHYDLSPIFKPYFEKNKLDDLFATVTTMNSEQKPLGVIKGENDILFNAFFFDSVESYGEVTVMIDGEEQMFDLKEALINEFEKETTDGAIFYLEGTFDNVYREAFGVRKNGVIKAWASDIEGMMPLQLKGAYHKVSDNPNNLLAQWMKQNNISMLVSSSAIKVHGSPIDGQDYKILNISELIKGSTEINQLPLSMFNRQSEKETYKNEGTGLSSGLSRNLFTKYNKIFSDNSLNSAISKVLERTKKDLDKALLSVSDSSLIETVVSILEKPSGSKMEQLMSKMIANVIMGRGLMTPAQYETLSDDFKVGQSRLQDEAFKEIGAIFHEPFFAKMFQSHIKSKINQYLGWDLPSYWGVIRPDTGYLESNHVETASRTLRLKLQRKKKNQKAKIDQEFDPEFLYSRKKNLEEIINLLEDDEESKEDLKEYKTELKEIEKKITDYERKINLLNINIEKEFNDRFEEMIDTKTGRLKEGWCFVSSDMAKALSPLNRDRITNEPEISQSKLNIIEGLSNNQLIAEMFDVNGINPELIEAGDFSELAKAAEGFKVLYSSPEHTVRELPVGNMAEITELVRKNYPDRKILLIGHVQTESGINIALVDEKGVVSLLEPNTGQSDEIIKLIGREALKFRNTTYNQRVTSETIDDLNDKLQGKDLIATAIPTDSIFSQQPVRIAAVLDDIESSSVIVDSNHWQTRAGKDYDIDTLLFTYYDPKYWRNPNYKAPEDLSSFEKAKAEYKNSYFMTIVKSLREGKKNLIKQMMQSYKERIPNEKIDSEKDLYNEKLQVKYVQSFLPATKAGNFTELSENLFQLLDMYPKKVGGLIKEKAFYTFLGQLGLKTKVSVEIPKNILDIYRSVTKEELNSTIEVDIDPTDTKRVTDLSMLFQRLLNDMVDKPTNTNSFYYEYEPDNFDMMVLKYGGNVKDLVKKLSKFLNRNYYSILESGSDDTIITESEAIQIEKFLDYIIGTLPKSITAAQETIFGNPFNARKDIHSINPDAPFTFHELVKQIKEQKYINKLLREKDFTKLGEFAIASIKEKINRFNFNQADQTIVTQFFNNISSIDNVDEVGIMKMYDGVDLNMIPELTVSLNDYVVWMRDYKKLVNSTIVNKVSRTIPSMTIYDILTQLNSVIKEAVKSTDGLQDNVSFLLTKYFFMPTGEEIQFWTSEDIYKQREIHRLKSGVIAILGAPNWTAFGNSYWKALGQELRILKAWANGIPALRQKDSELDLDVEIQHAYLENFDDIFDLVLKSKKTFPNETSINHIGKEYKDGDKLKPFKISAFKGLKERQELWLYPHKEGVGFVIKENQEGKTKNTFVYKNPQQLYLAANKEDLVALNIIEEIKKNARRAKFNKEGAIEQRKNYNFKAFDQAYTEMFLFFNSFHFQSSVPLEDRMQLAIRKVNEYSANNPDKNSALNYALKTLFNIPAHYTTSNSVKISQKSNYADMLTPYDKYSDNTLVWELILNTKPELASEIAKEQASIYTGETLEASQKIKTSIQQLMADNEVYFDVEPERKTPFLPGQEYSIKRNAFDPKNFQSAIDLVSKDWYKSAKKNDFDINLDESILTDDQIMNSALGFEFPDLLGRELFLPIKIKDVVNIFSGGEVITKIKGINFSQILVAKQKFFMEINRQVTAMENRVNTLINKEIETLILNKKIESKTVTEKIRSLFNKSKENLNADIVTSIASRVKENPFNVEVVFDEKGKPLFKIGEVTFKNIDDYINSLQLQSSTEKALEKAAALYRLKYTQYARVAERMVNYIDAKILQYEQFLNDAAKRNDTDNGAYGILNLLRGYRRRYDEQAKRLKNDFYPLSVPVNELEHLYSIYEESKVNEYILNRWNSYWHEVYDNFEDFKSDILAYEQEYADRSATDDMTDFDLTMIKEANDIYQMRKPMKQLPAQIRILALQKGWKDEVYLDLIYDMENFIKWFWDNRIQDQISIRSLKGVQKFQNIMFGSLHNDLSYFNWTEYAYWENNKTNRDKDSKLMSNLKRFMAMQSDSSGLRKEVIPLSKVKKGDTISFTYLYEYYDEVTTKTYSAPKVVTGVVKEVKGSTIRIENEKKSLQGLSELEMLQKGYTRILFEEGEEFTVDDIIAKQYEKHEEIKNSQEPITKEQTDMLYDLVKLGFLKEEDIAGYRNWTRGYASGVILPAYIEAINFRWRDKGYDKVKVTDIDYEEISFEYMTEEFVEVEERKTRRRRKFLTTNINGKEEPMVTLLSSEPEPDKRSFWKDRYKILQMLTSIWFLGGFKSGQQNWIDGSSQLFTDLGAVNWWKARFRGYTGKRKANIKQKIQEGDFEEMDTTFDKFLNQESFDPETQDKMKLVEALTLQYVLKHDLGEQGLQASFIQDVEGGVLGKISYTAKGFLRVFKEAEVMVRRKAAFYYAYKAVMIDGITDPNLAELVIEKGVSRTQSLYDVLYRRLGEDTDLGKLLFQFSQYGHYQWELLKQDYRISKHLDEKFQLGAYFKALLYGQHSINANRKIKYAQKLTYDMMFQSLALFFPGMRLGGAMNRSLIMMLRALVVALLDKDEEETKRTTEDWITSILSIMFGIGITYPLGIIKRFISPEKYFVEVTDEKGKVELEERNKNMYESIRDNEMTFARSSVAPSWWAMLDTGYQLAFKEKKYGESEKLWGYFFYKLSPVNPFGYKNRFMNPKEKEMGNYNVAERFLGEGLGKPTRLLEGMLPTNKFYLTLTKEQKKELEKLEKEYSKPEKGSIEERIEKKKNKKGKKRETLEERAQRKNEE